MITYPLLLLIRKYEKPSWENLSYDIEIVSAPVSSLFQNKIALEAWYVIILIYSVAKLTHSMIEIIGWTPTIAK